jgi:4,5-DOPA dioxygenase extradiol
MGTPRSRRTSSTLNPVGSFFFVFANGMCSTAKSRGNVTHNLRHSMAAMQRGDQSVPDWSSRFDRDLARAFEQRDEAFLVRALETDDGRASHPSPDHYLPLLYAAGATSENDALSYPVEGFDGSLSMRSVRWG